MQIRDRIKELRRVPARELRPNPRNWRVHPPAQQEALRGILAEVGYADALLARVLPDGDLELIDGHLRAETTPESLVPVLILDVDETEAAKILATHDPLTGMATADTAQLEDLLRQFQTSNPALADMLTALAESTGMIPPTEPALDDEEHSLQSSFQLLIECQTEDEQQQLYERLSREGFPCRVLTL